MERFEGRKMMLHEKPERRLHHSCRRVGNNLFQQLNANDETPPPKLELMLTCWAVPQQVIGDRSPYAHLTPTFEEASNIFVDDALLDAESGPPLFAARKEA